MWLPAGTKAKSHAKIVDPATESQPSLVPGQRPIAVSWEQLSKLSSLASDMSPSEQAEWAHYHFLNLRGKQSSNIVFTASRRKKCLFADRTHIRPVVACITRGERSILYMHTPGFLETFFLTPISHLHPMNIIQLSFCEVVSTSLPSQKEWDGGLCFLHMEIDLLPLLLISEGLWDDYSSPYNTLTHVHKLLEISLVKIFSRKDAFLNFQKFYKVTTEWLFPKTASIGEHISISRTL